MLFRLTSGPHGLETFSEEITFAFKCETQKTYAPALPSSPHPVPKSPGTYLSPGFSSVPPWDSDVTSPLSILMSCWLVSHGHSPRSPAIPSLSTLATPLTLRL